MKIDDGQKHYGRFRALDKALNDFMEPKLSNENYSGCYLLLSTRHAIVAYFTILEVPLDGASFTNATVLR